MKRMDKTITLAEIIVRMEELAREFTVTEGDSQRGFEILREFLQLNGQTEVLKTA